ncbi:TPA: hypothetical protein ACSP16_000535 [Aeromonas veronii]
MSMNNLKKEIEATLLITKWSPTDSDLHQISSKIKASGSNLTKRKLEEIVHEVIGSFGQMTMEGEDNSDLTTLLIMATKVENK